MPEAKEPRWLAIIHWLTATQWLIAFLFIASAVLVLFRLTVVGWGIWAVANMLWFVGPIIRRLKRRGC